MDQETKELLAQKITYETPMGSFDDWFLAAEACKRADMDPVTAIKVVRTGRPSKAQQYQARMRRERQKARLGFTEKVDPIGDDASDWGDGAAGPVFRRDR